jgi:hypothetical protein
MKGCTCPPQPEWPMIAFASDCPLHQKSVGRDARRTSEESDVGGSNTPMAEFRRELSP